MKHPAQTLICPICLAPHRTFRAVVSCHGDQLRRVTGYMATMEGSYSIAALLTNSLGPTARTGLLDRAGVEF